MSALQAVVSTQLQMFINRVSQRRTGHTARGATNQTTDDGTDE